QIPQENLLPARCQGPCKIGRECGLAGSAFGIGNQNGFHVVLQNGAILAAAGWRILKPDWLVSLRTSPHSEPAQLLLPQKLRTVQTERPDAPTRPAARDPSVVAAHPVSAGSDRPETSAWWSKALAGRGLRGDPPRQPNLAPRAP